MVQSIYTALTDTLAPEYLTKKVYHTYGNNYGGYFDSYWGRMREDTATQKVYFQSSHLMPEIDTTEFLLYDYSMHIGDSIYMQTPFHTGEGGAGSGNGYNIGWCTLDSITSYTSLAANRRLFTFHQTGSNVYWPNTIHWLEGVGILHFGWTSYLNCCFNNTVQLYKANFDSPILSGVPNPFNDTTYRNSCIVLIPGAVSQPVSAIDVQLYPNPANNKLQISCSLNQAYSMLIIDIFGRVAGRCNFTGKGTVISLSGLADGIYTAVIVAGDTRINKRFIKKEE